MMKNIDLKNRAKTGLLWKLIENFGTQGISFLISIILTRLLSPEDYGIIAYTTVFITFANIFIQTGFTSAIIQKKSIREIEYSSVFFAGIVLSTLLYLIIFILSPFIAIYFKEPILVWVLRAQSITLILGGLSSVHNTIIIRNFQFKKSFKLRMIANIAHGGVGISLAILGFGVWALVFGTIANQLVVTILLWLSVDWKPKIIFSMTKLKSLFSFSSRILFTEILNNVDNNIKSLIIGRSFSTQTLGFYNRGSHFPILIMINTDGALNTVMFPLFSNYQDNQSDFLAVYRRSFKSNIFIVFPLMIGLITVADPLITLMFTEKWLPSVPFLQITCLICMTWPSSLAFQAYNALGKVNVSLRLNLLSKFIGVIFMVITIQFGVYAFVLGVFISSVISSVINLFFCEKVFGYEISQQLRDLFPPLILSILMGMLVFLVGININNNWIKLLTQIFSGGLIYFGGAKLFKLDSLSYFINNLTNLIMSQRSQRKSL